MERVLMDPLSTTIFVIVAVLAILLTPLLILRLVGLHRTRQPDSPQKRIRLVVLAALVACAGISLLLEGVRPGMQVFESFGAAKRYGLPATYFLVAFALLMPFATNPSKRVSRPFWWGGLLFVVATGSFLSFVLQPQELAAIDIIQGLALTVGMLMISALGFRAADWPQDDQRLLMLTMGLGALLSQATGVGLGPFVALVVPVATALIYTGLRRRRFLVAVTGVAIYAILWFKMRGTATPSIAVLTQIGTCSGLLLLLAFGRGMRLFLAAIGTSAAIILSWVSGLWTLMLGDWRVTKEVTLSHRAYEAYVVWRQVSEDPTTIIFGMGPSATVDLMGSPDARTLRAAGRNLVAVDDVHFLTSWMLLKFGLLGLAWLVVFLCAFMRESLHVLNQRVPDIFDVFMLMSVAAGLVTSLPAATNFFANPLLPLFMGILYARRKDAQIRLQSLRPYPQTCREPLIA